MFFYAFFQYARSTKQSLIAGTEALLCKWKCGRALANIHDQNKTLAGRTDPSLSSSFNIYSVVYTSSSAVYQLCSCFLCNITNNITKGPRMISGWSNQLPGQLRIGFFPRVAGRVLLSGLRREWSHLELLCMNGIGVNHHLFKSWM